MKTEGNAINEISTVRINNAGKRFRRNRVILLDNLALGSTEAGLDNQYDEERSTHSTNIHSPDM
jgi:hypothetical protein